MLTTHRVVLLLRVLLVVAFGMVLLLQLMSVPGTLAYHAEQEPDFARVRWYVLAVLEVELVCVQVVVAATWRLLGMVREDRIFSDAAFRWVDVIIAAIGVAWTVWLVFGLTVSVGAEDPGLPLALAVIGLAVTVVGLLMLVMRALLRQATVLRSDMEAVI